MKDNNHPWYEYVTASQMFTTIISKLHDKGFQFKVNPEVHGYLYECILDCVHKDEDLSTYEVFDLYLGAPHLSNTAIGKKSIKPFSM